MLILSAWKWEISGQLGPKPKLLSKYKDWKSAHHKTFSISYSLVLLHGYFPGEYLKGLEMFSRIVNICTRGEVEHHDVQQLRRLSIRFFEHYKRCYARYLADRVDFCKYVFHIILHLADCMERYGSLIGVSQYWLEGYIGWLV